MTSGRDEDWQVYALAAGRLPARVRLDGRSIRIFRVGPIAVLAGTPDERPIEEALRVQHAVVLELARRFDPILPVRFGARMSEARIAAVVRPSVQPLLNALTHVRGRQQMTMRLFGPPEAPTPLATRGTEYLTRRLLARVIPREAAPLRDALSGFIADERIQPGRGSIRVTVFHLVNRKDIPSYVETAEDASHDIAPWRMSLSGPWPPFAFGPELSR
jgi:hypothetical protein